MAIFGKKAAPIDSVPEEEPLQRRGSWWQIPLHAVLILLAGAALLWGALAFLKAYTRFGEAVEVPDLKGMSRPDAVRILAGRDLEMEITDSVYVEAATPGIVMESNPRAGSRVKSGRVIFVTVNALNPRQIPLPQVIQLSKRQAVATLKGAGFVDIREKYVTGEFNDLVLAVKDGTTGVLLASGKRLSYNAPVLLEISSAMLLDSLERVERAMMMDSLARLGIGVEESPEPAAADSLDAAPAKPETPPADPAELPPADPADEPETDPDDWF